MKTRFKFASLLAGALALPLVAFASPSTPHVYAKSYNLTLGFKCTGGIAGYMKGPLDLVKLNAKKHFPTGKVISCKIYDASPKRGVRVGTVRFLVAHNKVFFKGKSLVPSAVGKYKLLFGTPGEHPMSVFVLVNEHK